MRKVVAVWSQKGGVGKTNIATNLAALAVSSGKRVLLVDSDEKQAAATEFGTKARQTAAKGRPHTGALTVLSGDDRVHLTLPRLVENYDLVVIDCPGFQTRAQRSALMVADVIVVPVGGGPSDRVGLAETVKELGQLQASLVADGRAAIRILGVPSSVDLRRAVGHRARQFLELIDLTGWQVAKTTIADRSEYVESADLGEPVTTYAPKSEAAKELRSFAAEVNAMLEAKPNVKKKGAAARLR